MTVRGASLRLLRDFVGSWLDPVLTWLFKYPPRAFAQGEWVLAPVLSPLLLAIMAGVGLTGLVVLHARLRTVPRRDRTVLAIARSAVLLLLLACLLRPGLVLATAVPQRNVLALLIDDSRSMRIRDGGDPSASLPGTPSGRQVGAASRLSAVQQRFADSTALVRTLGARFALRRFRFAATASPVARLDSLTASGTRSDLALALSGVRDELHGQPLAGIVLVSDGADNAGGDLDDALLAGRAARVPVYTVGVGTARFTRDLAVERVQAPRQLLQGARAFIEADVRIRGARTGTVPVTVEADGQVVAREEVAPPVRGDLVTVRLRVPPLPPGAHRLAVRVRPDPDELVTENNAVLSSLDVRSGPARILYVEGEPRPEFPFLRRAMAGDTAVQIVGLMRSAEHKYLRLGVRDSLELLGGFPTTREELFQYRGIILGSIEAGVFTTDQLRMLADFVNVRGGGLLALGGRAALAEGGYAGTPLADVLPLTMGAGKENAEGPALAVQLRPTREGEPHPALQLRETLAASVRLWDSLPPLTSVNTVGTLRPGAAVLLTGRTDDGRELPMLTWQRYGRGLSALFGVQDSWLWRMDASVPVEDVTHQTFWRQLSRWLVEEAPAPLMISAEPSRVGPGEPVTLRALVRTPLYAEINDATVTVTLTAPSGKTTTLPLEWSLRNDGSYTARLTPTDTGRYAIEVVAQRGREPVQSALGTLLVDDGGADVAPAELQQALLQRIASATGGRYYPLEDAGQIATDAVYTNAGVTVREAKDLWDMPAVLLLLLLLLSAEWGYRRWRGLA